MTSIWTEVEGWFAPEEAAVEAFVKTVSTDVTAWVKAEANLVVEDAQFAWSVLVPVLTALGPAQWTILQGLVKTASADAAAGDYTAIATAVLQQATTAETAFVTQLGVELVGVLTAVLAYKSAPATTA